MIRTTRHHHIRVEIISNYEAMTIDDIVVDKFGFYLVVPAGFKTDGASVPKWCWSLGFSPFCLDTLRGAIVHDYLYRRRLDIPRYLCDAIFLALMKESGASLCKRLTYFLMVRVFGWIPRLFY
jgi:hypothetical protein